MGESPKWQEADPRRMVRHYREELVRLQAREDHLADQLANANLAADIETRATAERWQEKLVEIEYQLESACDELREAEERVASLRASIVHLEQARDHAGRAVTRRFDEAVLRAHHRRADVALRREILGKQVVETRETLEIWEDKLRQRKRRERGEPSGETGASAKGVAHLSGEMGATGEGDDDIWRRRYQSLYHETRKRVGKVTHTEYAVQDLPSAFDYLGVAFPRPEAA